METKLRHRVIGLLVLGALGLIFIPLLFKENHPTSKVHNKPAFSGQIPTEAMKPAPQQLSSNPQPVVISLQQQPSSGLPPEQTAVERHANVMMNGAPIPSANPQPLSSPEPIPAVDSQPEAPLPKVVQADPPAKVRFHEPEHSKLVKAAKIHTPKKSHPTSLASNKKATPHEVTAAAWVVQLGCFSGPKNAIALQKQLQSHGYAAYLQSNHISKNALTRVFVGPQTQRNQAVAVLDKLQKELKIKGMIVPYTPKTKDF